jgi:sialate O-acetylesterase
MPPLGPESPAAPGVLWNGMIAPLRPYAMRGVIWYQGETNAPRAEQYRTLLPAMIQSWREAWKADDSTASPEEDFAFLVVTLANWKPAASQPSQPSDWAEIREAQSLAATKLPKVDYVVITDIGDTKDIHPRNKQEVARRLALAARRTAYGEKDVESHGPRFKEAKFDAGRAIVAFDGNVRVRGDKALGFLIADNDKQWHFADAKIEGDRAVVSSPEVKSPAAVRYNWADNPVGNLFGENGLPVEPFRSDDWPLSTAGAR